MNNLIVQYDTYTIPLKENQTAIMLTEGKVMSDNVKITFPLISSDNNENIIEVEELPKNNLDPEATYLYQGQKYKGKLQFFDIAYCTLNQNDEKEFVSFMAENELMKFFGSLLSLEESLNFGFSCSEIMNKENNENIKISNIDNNEISNLHLYYIHDEENEKVWYKTSEDWYPLSSLLTIENEEGEEENLPYRGNIFYFSEIEEIEPVYYAIFKIDWTPEKVIEVSSLPTDLAPYSLYKKENFYYSTPKKIQQIYHVMDKKIYTLEELFIEGEKTVNSAFFPLFNTYYYDVPFSSLAGSAGILLILLLIGGPFILPFAYYPEILPENADTNERLYCLGQPYSETLNENNEFPPLPFLGEISKVEEIIDLETQGYYILTGPEEILAPIETKTVYESGIHDVLEAETLIVQSERFPIFGKYCFDTSLLESFPENLEENFTFICNGEKYYGIVSSSYGEDSYFILEDGSKTMVTTLGSWDIPYNENNNSVDLYFDFQTVSTKIYSIFQRAINLSQNYSFKNLYYFNVIFPINNTCSKYIYSEELTLWKEWINSENNTDNFFISGEEIHIILSEKEYKVKDVGPNTLLLYSNIYYLEEVTT